jgi:nucleotide-binding universal stress UspA family protein
MQNIVVAYDGSDQAKRALERAATLGRAGASVTIVTGVSIGLHGPRSMGAVDQDELSAAKDTLEAARASLKSQGIDAHAIEGTGDAADVVIEAAKECKADLIVVGTRGLGKAKRLALGSVSSKIVHDAACDVLVVR